MVSKNQTLPETDSSPFGAHTSNSLCPIRTPMFFASLLEKKKLASFIWKPHDLRCFFYPAFFFNPAQRMGFLVNECFINSVLWSGSQGIFLAHWHRRSRITSHRPKVPHKVGSKVGRVGTVGNLCVCLPKTPKKEKKQYVISK